jgi:hypothetical protein
MNYSYLAACYRLKTNSFAVHEFPKGDAFNWEVLDHVFMANDKVLALGGGFMPLGYGTVAWCSQEQKEKAFEAFYEMALDELKSTCPIPPCDIQEFEPPQDFEMGQ